MGSLRIRIRMSCATVKDVSAAEFIKTCAEHLKKDPKFDVPKYHDIVKTGTFKEFAPYDEGWVFIRTASICRKVYLRKGTGVGALKKWYGGSSGTHRGTRKAHFAKASGAIIRAAMQALETLGWLEHDNDGGRVMTRTGRQSCDRFASKVSESSAPF